MSHSLKTNRVAFRPSMGETTTGLEDRISPAHVSVAAVGHAATGFKLPGQGTGSLTSPQVRATTAPKVTGAYQLPGQGTGSLTSPQVRATAVTAAAGTYHLPGQGTGSLTTPQVRGFFHK